MAADRAILIGGPRDGLEITAGFVGQPIIQTPEPGRFWLAERADDMAPEVVTASTYSLEIVQGGYGSRDDQGRLRYRYTGSS